MAKAANIRIRTKNFEVAYGVVLHYKQFLKVDKAFIPDMSVYMTAFITR